MSDFIVGLTGGVASGKSEVTRRFQALGVEVVDADVAAREVVEPGQPALARIAERFGAGMLLADGRLDRRQLRERVFADAQARRDLEAITHPAIRARVKAQAQAAPGPYAVVAVPLLAEAGRAAYPWMARVLVVDAPESLQHDRLMRRDGVDEALAEHNAALPRLQDAMAGLDTPHLAELAVNIRTYPELADLLQRAIIDNPPAVIRDGGVLKTGYDAELDELQSISENAGQYLMDLEAREKARTGLANLKVGYNRVHGYFIELPSKQAESAPADYIRRQTLKGAERFITPELKTFEDKALSAKSRALAREKQLYEALLEQLIGELAPLQETAAALAELRGLIAAHSVVTLLYAARDTTCNNAEALRLWLEAGAGGC